ncbi:hypothetical protein BDA96_04G254400 [Sorghum bicolor]|uniref:Uncharacterized protein n=1 Tax=Sorghum bicolor TaxID=4558 RepID=A0A921R544_SORBI|nr:hypothetical protein BDA96_04G254400 [Sorghum bicolor]
MTCRPIDASSLSGNVMHVMQTVRPHRRSTGRFFSLATRWPRFLMQDLRWCDPVSSFVPFRSSVRLQVIKVRRQQSSAWRELQIFVRTRSDSDAWLMWSFHSLKRVRSLFSCLSSSLRAV